MRSESLVSAGGHEHHAAAIADPLDSDTLAAVTKLLDAFLNCVFRLATHPVPAPHTHLDRGPWEKEVMPIRHECERLVDACVGAFPAIGPLLPPEWVGTSPDQSRFISAKRALETMRWYLHDRNTWRGHRMPMPPDQHFDDVKRWEDAERTVRAFWRDCNDLLLLRSSPPFDPSVRGEVSRATGLTSFAQEAPKRRRGGSPLSSDPNADARIFDAWASGHYKCYAELADELKREPRSIKLAIDRHRKRLRARSPDNPCQDP